MADVEVNAGSLSLPDTQFPPLERRVLAHDDAGTYFPEWVPLLNGSLPAGIIGAGGDGLELVSPDVTTAAPAGQIFGCSALRRLTRPAGVGKPGGLNKIYLEWEWYLRVFRSNNAVFTFCKGVQFGLDTADWGVAGSGGSGPGGLEPVAARRTLAMCRCLIFDEGNGDYYGGKWQITHGAAGAPSYVDLTDLSGNLLSPTVAGYEALQVGMNQGKWMRQHTEQVFDLTGAGVTGATTAVLEGIRHNGVGFGSLSGGPVGYSPDLIVNPRAAELLIAGFVPAQSTDVNFQGGLNLYCQIDNRSNQLSKATLVATRVRALAFA
jgi:hypothetical protein